MVSSATQTAQHAVQLKTLMSELQTVTREVEASEESRVDELKDQLKQIRKELTTANEQVREKEKLLDVYKEVGNLMWSVDESVDKAKRFAQRLFDAMPFHRLIFLLIEGEKRELKIIQDIKRVKSQPDSRRVRFEIERVTEEVVRTGKSKVIERSESTVVFLPVEANDVIIGVVMFAVRQWDRTRVLNHIKLLEPLIKMGARAL